MWDLTAIFLLYLAFGFKKSQVVAQNGFFVQNSKQKADENTNPNSIFDQRQEAEQSCHSGLATLTMQELCSARSSSAPSSCWHVGLWIKPQISTPMLTTWQESVVSPGNIHLLQLWPLTNNMPENESGLILLALPNFTWWLRQHPARPWCSLLKWGKCVRPISEFLLLKI